MMSQDPNIPKITISDGCKGKAGSLISALDFVVRAAEIARVNPDQAASYRLDAFSELIIAKGNDFIDIKTFDAISTKLQDVKTISEAEILIIDALLNFAVDCECREAKAMEAQRGEEALQTVLEPGEKITGRARILTEIPGKEEGE